LLGRYSGDTYTGCSQGGGGTQGHAWILCSNALGDFYYRNADLISKSKDSETWLTPKKLRACAKHFAKDQYPGYEMLIKSADLWENNLLSIEEKREVAKNLAQLLVTQGDAQMIRLKYHITGCDYHMSEQLCETNGYEVGANDLTWAYGTFLSAWYYRGLSIENGIPPLPLANKIDYFNLKQKLTSNPYCPTCTNQCG